MPSEVDRAGLGSKILELLKAGPGSEIELSLLHNGSVLVSRSGKEPD